ncbi:hypothetical protein JF50_00890 [Pseudoalteromonas luteoviolacea]|uniref:Uncharacterized protein n=1 Tax=Pseudoalteromonas luteoviolacea TaxID=43657 RepID=A0A0C1MPP6_9GAMM|nr:hypothetical protein [Pseudoalteromonas luteoviolacea]KID59044.1 hypothetical protein JF50_00890 [Pseudoalteromonas luteoviolacea]
MYAPMQKKEDKSRVVANSLMHKKHDRKKVDSDNRPKAILQRFMTDKLNNRSQALAIKCNLKSLDRTNGALQLMQSWELSDLKTAVALKLKDELKEERFKIAIDSMIENGNNAGLSFSELFELVSGLYQWAKFKSSKDNARSGITKLSKAIDKNKFLQDYAEIKNGLERGKDAGFEVLSDGVIESIPGDVILNAKKGVSYDLGKNCVVKVDPVDEADALYLGYDGKVHLEEVKATPQAFFEKLATNPKQFDRLIEWKKMSPEDRVVTVRIRSDEKIDSFANSRLNTDKNVLSKLNDYLSEGLEVLVAGKPITDYNLVKDVKN